MLLEELEGAEAVLNDVDQAEVGLVQVKGLLVLLREVQEVVY